MLDTINGLPVHILVVHAVVVLLPLAALGAIAIAVKPSWRHRYGFLVLALTVIATAAVPVAASSGKRLVDRIGDPGDHAVWGDQLIWFVLPWGVLVAAVVLVPRRWNMKRLGSALLSAATVLAALVAIAAVIRVGDSGATAVWGDVVKATTP
ncbi:MAG: DUF2231 domain-containing protein [Actinomycetota bacterium]